MPEPSETAREACQWTPDGPADKLGDGPSEMSIDALPNAPLLAYQRIDVRDDVAVSGAELVSHKLALSHEPPQRHAATLKAIKRLSFRYPFHVATIKTRERRSKLKLCQGYYY